MVWSLDWDRGFVVGGDANRRLTPNFRLSEFMDSRGKVRVHRELVSALQILRERFARAMLIKATDPDGLGATVTGGSPGDLLEAARRVALNKVFDKVDEQDGSLHVRIPDPAKLPEIGLEQALETAFSITSAFETSGDRFQQITGNFDGAGLSFGPAQWNFKSKTLVPLFRKFEAADKASLQACFSDEVDYEEWQKVMESSVDKQIAWANDISTGRGGHDVVAPWKSYFQAVGRVKTFRAIMVEQALRKYGARLLEAVSYLQGLRPDIQIDHLRCMCSLYDLVIQQGSLNRAKEKIEQRVSSEAPGDQFELVAIAVEERGNKANEQWRADCCSRRLGILRGLPIEYRGKQRANINFYLLRDVRIRGARDLLTADVSSQLKKVSEALAAGDSLLA